MEADFRVEAVEEALARHGTPEIFNADRGAQFTSHAFTSVLLKAGIAISMDGEGAWRDNIFVERLWRSIEHEEIYLRAYHIVSTARASIRATISTNPPTTSAVASGLKPWRETDQIRNFD